MPNLLGEEAYLILQESPVCGFETVLQIILILLLAGIVRALI